MRTRYRLYRLTGHSRMFALLAAIRLWPMYG